jgi:corrinoid protein of di/trimethylamine methyltransferase
MLGQSILEFLSAANNVQWKLFSVGLNCLTDVAAMTPLVKELAQFGVGVSLYPNMGTPDSQGHYTKAPEELLRDVWPLLEGHHLNIIGGCCGTTDAFTRLLAKAVEPVEGIFLSPKSSTDPTLSREEKRNPIKPISHPNENETAAELITSPLSLKKAILSGDSEAAIAATRDALAAGHAPQQIIDQQMIAAMAEIGQLFQDGKAFVPQLLMAARAMKSALEIVKPLIADDNTGAKGRVVIGTVKGDLHDIGKNLVAAMLEGNGFEVINIGVDVSADAFVEAVREHKPNLLCLSALLTTTMDYMRKVIAALEAAGLRQQVKVMVGGAPVTQAFADDIGADGYADNANGAVIVAKSLQSN